MKIGTNYKPNLQSQAKLLQSSDKLFKIISPKKQLLFIFIKRSESLIGYKIEIYLIVKILLGVSLIDK
jgi:hypothetical protein